MKCPAWLVLALFSQLFAGIPVTRSQKTHDKQKQSQPRHGHLEVRIPDQGTVLGKEIPQKRPPAVIQYLGIPYAQPPTGKLRFSAPVTDPLPSWSGVRNATQFAPSCQQVTNRRKLHEKLYQKLLPTDQPDPGVSEDCLYLNIFMHDGFEGEVDRPVMVWFHGGDFNTGTPAIWDASYLVNKQKVIVVTVAYRLNILGYFTTTDGEAPGNYGMLDQVAALDWVQKKIHKFGGSASSVVIFGHSSGAISVGLHLISPMSKGKFSKAIAMSGDAVTSVGSPRAELPVVDIIAEKFGCYRRPTSSLMECLRRVNVNILVRESSDIETWGPIVDAETNNATEPFLPMHPRDAVDSGQLNSVPFLTGYTNNEQALAYKESLGKGNSDGRMSLNRFEMLITDEFLSAVSSLEDNSTCETRPEMVADAVLFFYKPHPPSKDQDVLRDRYLDLQTEKNFAAGLTLLAGRISNEKSAFVYRFDYRPETKFATSELPKWAGVPHMFELPFVWGLPGLRGNTIQWNYADTHMAEVMTQLLANFAKSGIPSAQNVKWEPYTEEKPGILIIGKTSNMSDGSDVDYRALAFWNEYYPRLLEEAMNNCCNVTSAATEPRAATPKIAIGGIAIAALSYLVW
ncbi:carboxylesterase 1C [Lasioglossum baleicum]|uniref:carboxylesterase 1C n=1 Tax=Lasioglossum baleicum TaxID=434251 RepID=UPI003FCE01AE